MSEGADAAQASGDQGEHLEFPFGEPAQSLGDAIVGWRAMDVFLDQPSGEAGG